ncbi:hypothetical protein BV898_10631 [Hypsibius exemplaris]|uniref:Uncharacterized protein n=1 Tax=Hypsibius exemplaris TaxID=2072580 RepID=A0A1W0WJA1_HYPEX|nr:hypothetical protein BV898_10631 [Hypsibius exemplaris]
MPDNKGQGFDVHPEVLEEEQEPDSDRLRMRQLSTQNFFREESYEAFVAQHEDGPCAVPGPNPLGDTVPELVRRESTPYDYDEQQLEEVTHLSQKVGLKTAMQCDHQTLGLKEQEQPPQPEIPISQAALPSASAV